MKKIVILLAISCIVFSVNSQTIINPSATPGYDAQKLLQTNTSGSTGASLLADSADYQPGSLATFTGSGFIPGETIDMFVEHVIPPSTGPAHQPWTTVADANGDFVTTWIVGNECFGQHLLGSATGQISGQVATVAFTDALPLNTCFIAPDSTYTVFPGNDDGSLGPISLPFTFTLYGTNYNSVYINNNGNLTFSAPSSAYTAS
jgi:hypothetical protein